MWTLTKNKDWQQLQQFSWVKDMQGVPQSPVHHAEGDVATHTQMVLDALINLADFKSLDQQAQENLWVAALMHDIEKRSTTTVDDNGNIVSPGHAKKGAKTTGKILYREYATPFFIREQVAGLVRYHGLPLWIFEKPDPVKAIIQASLETDTVLLAMLAKVDVLGRSCNDANELLYKIELFTELAKEYECWGKPKQFYSDLSRFQYFYKEGRHPDFESFDDTKTSMILLSGIAGSGKDYYISKNYPTHPVISLDDMRRKAKTRYGDTKGNGQIIQLAKETAKKYLRNSTPFIWNATNITRQMRGQLIDMAERYQAMIKIIYLEAGYHKLLAQNKNRDFEIPGNAIERMIEKLEVPKVWEAPIVEYVVE